ncbi:MAG: tRNA (cytidine(34)-2'-O)-methyltransferase [Rickettsiales bacterium]|nr:tRNA (cytidine(34)-2'-O)-methyltransferase [Rickettsiales bacterium]
MVHLVVYQPDIPQNLGAMIRLSACLGIDLHIVEPCGFPVDDKRIRRASMDYFDLATIHRHASWDAFVNQKDGRLVLMTTKGSAPYTDHTFEENDYIVLGRESAGVPESVHEQVDARIIIPMAAEARSLNLAMSAAIVTGEAIRQCTQNS